MKSGDRQERELRRLQAQQEIQLLQLALVKASLLAVRKTNKICCSLGSAPSISGTAALATVSLDLSFSSGPIIYDCLHRLKDHRSIFQRGAAEHRLAAEGSMEGVQCQGEQQSESSESDPRIPGRKIHRYWKDTQQVNNQHLRR